MKAPTYSTYEAKARFSEILRKVRSGESVFISYRGEEVAEIRPIARKPSTEEALRRLREKGVLGAEARPEGTLAPRVRRPGALARFLESRE